jgi:hypothetical protein
MAERATMDTMENPLDEALFESYDAYDGPTTTTHGVPVDAQIATLNQLNRSLQAELDKSLQGPSLSLRPFDALLRSLDGDSDDPLFSLGAPYDADDNGDGDDADADLLELSAELDSVWLSPYTPTHAGAAEAHGSDSGASPRHRISDHWQSPLLSPMPTGAVGTQVVLSGVKAGDSGSVMGSGSRDGSGASSAFLSNSFIVQVQPTSLH